MTLRTSIDIQQRVIGAIILRDMRTRFGRTHVGYLIAIAWPLMHATFILVANGVMSRISPLGGDPIIFVATGIIPYIMCFYPSRQMTFSVEHNRALLLFPRVRVSDIIFARAILEFLTSFVVAVLFVGMITIFFGINIRPVHTTEAITGVLAAMYFGIAIGFINTVIMSIFKFWNVVQILMMIIMYISSGAIVSTATLPQELQNIIWFNPLMHLVEWIRMAYYEDNGSDILSKEYVLIFSTYLLFSGLLGERFIRGKILMS